VVLHQLHPLLVHAALFGGGYGRRAVSAAAAFG
jgi:fructosamine-3-kinase